MCEHYDVECWVRTALVCKYFVKQLLGLFKRPRMLVQIPLVRLHIEVDTLLLVTSFKKPEVEYGAKSKNAKKLFL